MKKIPLAPGIYEKNGKTAAPRNGVHEKRRIHGRFDAN
jgi:hypothetical protein